MLKRTLTFSAFAVTGTLLMGCHDKTAETIRLPTGANIVCGLVTPQGNTVNAISPPTSGTIDVAALQKQVAALCNTPIDQLRKKYGDNNVNQLPSGDDSTVNNYLILSLMMNSSSSSAQRITSLATPRSLPTVSGEEDEEESAARSTAASTPPEEEENSSTSAPEGDEEESGGSVAAGEEAYIIPAEPNALKKEQPRPIPAAAIRRAVAVLIAA